MSNAMNISSPCVFILLIVSFLSLPHFHDASLLSDACSRAASDDPTNVNCDFCITSLQADPKSESANLTGLIRISLNLAIKNVIEDISNISYLLSKPQYAHLKDELSDCQDVYHQAISNLNDAVKQFDSSRRDHSQTNMKITEGLTDIDTCADISTDKSILSEERANAIQLCAMALNFLYQDFFV